MWKIAKNGYLCNCLLHGNSLQYTYMNENGIPGVFLIFTVNARSLNPKLKQNTSFLVPHPFSGVDTVKTVGSHLNNVFPISPLPDKFVSLFKVMPLSQCPYLGGGTKARICPTTLADSKWRPVPLKRDGCLIPNLIGTYLCGAKNGKQT